MPINPLRRTLPGGIVVVAKETNTTPAVTILVGLRAGAYYDPGGAEGTAALLARVLDRGTETRTAADIADELDGRGASLSVIAGRHQLTVSATCLAEDFEAIFELVAEVICRPRFDEAEVETRRAELITAILQDEDDPGAVAVDVLMGRLYPTHPYGRRPRGTTATVRGITRADLVTFHRSWFGPEGTTVVVTGDVTPATVIQVTERWFSPWRAERCAEPPLADVGLASTRDFFVVPMMSKAQADVAYGVIGVRRADPSYYDAWVMNNALGQYALGGRLGDSIRERQGMAYYVYSSLDATLAAGPLMIRAGVSAENVERTLASIDYELALVREEGLTPKEFDESKRYLIGSIPRQLETNAGIAGFLLSAEFHGLGPDYDRDLPGFLEAVTLDGVNAVARRLLDPSKAVVVVAGPWQMTGGSAAAALPLPDASAATLVARVTSPR
ncbi:MAG: pitrilysin family protein [Vicinamibacterales bacterium]